MREAFRLIPQEFRKRGIAVIVSGFVRALLNFVSIAVLLPVLYLIVEPEKMQTNHYVQYVYNLFGFTSSTQFVLAVCLVVIGIIVVKNVLNILLYRFQTNYLLALFRYFSRRIFCVYHWRGLLFLKKTNSAKLANDVNFVCLAYVLNVLSSYSALIIEFVFSLMMFASMLLVNAKAALLIVAVFVPIIAAQFIFMKKYAKIYGKKENDARWQQQKLVFESFKGYAEIELNNTLPIIAERFEEGQKTISKYRRKIELTSQIPLAVVETLIIVALVILVLMKVKLVVFGVFALMALRMLPSVRNIMGEWLTIKNNHYTIEIVEKGCAEYKNINNEKNGEKMTFNKNIEIQNLTFTFEDGVSIIKDFSLEIKKGERIGIQGESGSGKTTLFNLLLGFYPPTSGKILIDGVELNKNTKRGWQNIIGYVPQEVFIMDTTIAENICLGNNCNNEKVKEVLQMASLSEFISTLPKGIDTTIGECGNRLSGGQKQRIGIARALYKDAEVLFLDEATSSLDRKTENEINEAIENLSKQHKELTIIVISHHDMSLKFCDRIITINKN